MFEQAFRNIDNVLRREAGCSSELDYAEQISWILFLKYLDDLEQERERKAGLLGKSYKFILDEDYRWASWAAPKNDEGDIDHNRMLIGDDLIKFINNKLFPYLSSFKSANGAATIEYKIGEIFSEITNKFQNGYSLRDVLTYMNDLHFRSQKEKDELSQLYEVRIKNMGNAGRNGGEYYTPRPLISAMVQVLAPQMGETIYDGACGSAGFLCEAYNYLRAGNLTASQLKCLLEKTFYGKEKKSLAYIIGIMNMILHGVDAPNIVHTNTLSENISDIQEKDRHDIILANPPFGGKERREIQQNFPIRTGETASLFLQHFIKKLKAGGRAAVVIKNTFLSNADNGSRDLREDLLTSCNLHTVLDCPSGTFPGTGVKTVVLFFEKGAPTRNIWYYQLDLERTLGKSNPLNEEDLKEFIKRQKKRSKSPSSWVISVTDIDTSSYDLSVRNPHVAAEKPVRMPKEILHEIELLDSETTKQLERINKLL